MANLRLNVMLLAHVLSLVDLCEGLRITHSYPKNRNFSYVSLTCLDSNAEQFTSEAAFQLNGTDINTSEMEKVRNSTSFTINFVLSQAEEGEFTCSSNGTISNVIALAGNPLATLHHSHI